MRKLIDTLVDKYHTWRTGKSKEQRDWEVWYEVNVNYRASTVDEMFSNFKYVIKLNPDKFFKYDPFVWVPCDDAMEYFWPNRPLGQNAVWRFEPVKWDEHEQRWLMNVMGTQEVFVATNNDADILMLSLLYV